MVSRLSAFGLEARHLRSFRVVTDRETGLVEQMATPYSQPRDRDGRAREQEVVRELAALLIQLHATLLQGGTHPRRPRLTDRVQSAPGGLPCCVCWISRWWA